MASNGLSSSLIGAISTYPVSDVPMRFMAPVDTSSYILGTQERSPRHGTSSQKRYDVPPRHGRSKLGFFIIWSLLLPTRNRLTESQAFHNNAIRSEGSLRNMSSVLEPTLLATCCKK